MELYQAQDYILRELKKKGVVDATVNAYKDESVQQKFANNEIVMTKKWIDKNITVFVAIGKRGAMRTGSTSIQVDTKEKISEKIDKLIKFVNLTQINTYYDSIANGVFKYPKISGIYDKKLRDLSGEDTNISVDAITTALDAGAKNCFGNLETSWGEERLVTTNGADIIEAGTDIRLSLRAFVDEFSSSHKVVDSRNLKDFHPYQASKLAGKTARDASKLQTVKIPAGKYNILFDNLPFSNIMNQVGMACSAFNIETENSFFINKLNKKVADERFTLYDWGNLDGGLNSGSFDDEGRPTQKTNLISNGSLKTYLHNTSTAIRQGAKSTSNAGIIFPEPTNLVVTPGKMKPEKFLSELKNGLYVTNNWYTRFQNYKTGDFSTLPRDATFLVKNGKIVGRVSSIRISDNMLRILNNIKSLGDKTTVQYISGWEVEIPCRIPTAIIKDINITKPETK